VQEDLAVEHELNVYLKDALTYDQEDFPLVRTPKRKFTSVDNAMDILGPDSFRHLFGCNYAEAVELIELLFDDITLEPYVSAKAGRSKAGKGCCGTEAFFLMMGRLRHANATVQFLAHVVRRSESYVSWFSREAIYHVYSKFKFLLCFTNLGRFSQFTELWSERVVGAFSKHIGEEYEVLPGIFGNGCVFVDNVRIPIAKPHMGQRAYYSGWNGSHSQTRTTVNSPCGLFLAVSRGFAEGDTTNTWHAAWA
jgi:hypothetical protein